MCCIQFFDDDWYIFAPTVVGSRIVNKKRRAIPFMYGIPALVDCHRVEFTLQTLSRYQELVNFGKNFDKVKFLWDCPTLFVHRTILSHSQLHIDSSIFNSQWPGAKRRVNSRAIIKNCSFIF